MECRKLSYPTKEKAKQALKIVRKKHRNNKHQEQSLYSCPNCNKWHLTSHLQRSK